MRKKYAVHVVSKEFGVTRANLFTRAEPYTFGGFMIVSFVGFRAIREAALSQAQRVMLDDLMLKVEYGNLVAGLVMGEYAKELEITPQHVSRCLARLEQCDFVLRRGNGTLYLNPNYWFKGTAKEQQASVFKWHQMKQKRRSAA